VTPHTPRRGHNPVGRKRDTEAGLTLVELMVTLIIAGLVTSSTFIFFAGQKQVYEHQTKMLNVQQNLWAAMETITRHVRAAGTGMVGCVRPDADDTGPDTGAPPPVGSTPPLTGLRVDTAWSPNSDYATGPNRLAPLWIINGGSSDPDALVVVYGSESSGNFTDTQLGSASPVNTHTAAISTPTGLGSTFRAGEFILLVDNTANPTNLERGCTLYQLNSISTDLLQPGADPDDPAANWNPKTTDALLYPLSYEQTNTAIRNFGRLRWVRFAVDETGPQPVLTMHRMDIVNSQPQVLAEGIVDLQIAYACDLQPPAGPDGVLTEDLANPTGDEWTLNAAGDTPPADCNQPQAIRITLVARPLSGDSAMETIQGGNVRPAVEDRAAGTTNVGFRFRRLRTTVYPRNQ